MDSRMQTGQPVRLGSPEKSPDAMPLRSLIMQRHILGGAPDRFALPGAPVQVTNSNSKHRQPDKYFDKERSFLTQRTLQILRSGRHLRHTAIRVIHAADGLK